MIRKPKQNRTWGKECSKSFKIWCLLWEFRIQNITETTKPRSKNLFIKCFVPHLPPTLPQPTHKCFLHAKQKSNNVLGYNSLCQIHINNQSHDSKTWWARQVSNFIAFALHMFSLSFRFYAFVIFHSFAQFLCS